MEFKENKNGNMKLPRKKKHKINTRNKEMENSRKKKRKFFVLFEFFFSALSL